MSIIEYLKGEIEAIGTLIEQKTREIEQLTKRKLDIEQELESPAPEAEEVEEVVEVEVPKEEPIEEKAETVEETEEEAPAEEEEEAPSYASWDRDRLKAELEARDIEFAKNAKTDKLVALLQESDQ
jgi:hypothetical protein